MTTFKKVMFKLALQKKTSWLIIGLISLLIANFDKLTPPEVPIDAFYAFPIWLALLVYGLGGGFTASGSTILLYFISNYLFVDPDNPQILASVGLTFCIYLVFSYGAYRFILNQRQLSHIRFDLESRLEEINRLYLMADQLHQENMKLAIAEERNRLAREIHDVLAQGFTAIILQVAAAETAYASQQNPGVLQHRLAKINELAHLNLTEARRSVANLRPQPLEGVSLTESLERKVANFGTVSPIKASFAISGEVQSLSGETETTLYRIAQEALTNVERHSGASQVQVTLDYDEDEVCLTVQDNGIGFEKDRLEDQASKPDQNAFGLKIMQERAGLIGGWVTIHAKGGEGCRVRVIVPYASGNSSLKTVTLIAEPELTSRTL